MDATTARIMYGIAAVLVLVALLAISGHESVVDRGVNYGTAPVRSGAKAAKSAGKNAATSAASTAALAAAA